MMNGSYARTIHMRFGATRRTYLAVAVAAGLIAAGSAVGLGLRAAHGDRAGATVQAPAPLSGCVEAPTSELYAQHRYACGDGTAVYTFADDTARDAWASAAAGIGTVVLARGDGWVKVAS